MTDKKDIIKQEYEARKQEIRQKKRQLNNELKTAKNEYRLSRKNADHRQERVEEDFRAYAHGLSGQEEILWGKLDNTALVYPVITGEGMSNVYRISITLTEMIREDLLQKALDIVLPKFDVFDSRMRTGVFWYYFEQNGKPAPKVYRENAYPCQYINPAANRDYLFRITYFRSRINLEVFHVLTDGMGALGFLKELTYQYLRLSHPELQQKYGDKLSSTTSLNTEDSFLSNYDHEKRPLRPYSYEKAFLLKGTHLPSGMSGIMTVYMKVSDVKKAAARYEASINEYITAALNWSIYQEYQGQIPADEPLKTVIPVNLRPFFHSVTTKNFFLNVSAVFRPKEQCTFDDTIAQIRQSLRSQIQKETLQERLSVNVSTEQSLLSRSMPMIFKRPAMKIAYNKSAQASTLTVTNLGKQDVLEPYRKYVRMFGVILAHSKGQPLKGSLVSYDGILSVTISSILKSSKIQERFFRFLTQQKIRVCLETNGVYV